MVFEYDRDGGRTRLLLSLSLFLANSDDEDEPNERFVGGPGGKRMRNPAGDTPNKRFREETPRVSSSNRNVHSLWLFVDAIESESSICCASTRRDRSDNTTDNDQYSIEMPTHVRMEWTRISWFSTSIDGYQKLSDDCAIAVHGQLESRWHQVFA